MSAAGFGSGAGGEEPPGGDGWPGRDGRPPVDLEIPDDARELDAEVRAYRREIRGQRLRARLRHVFLTRRWDRYGLSGPLVAAILVLVALVGSLAILLGPRTPTPAPQVPLATNPPASPGRLGGLLPSVSLTFAGQLRGIRGLRPAVLALVPGDCRCEPALDALFRQAQEYELPVVLVGDDAAGLRRLGSKVGNGTARAAEDRAQVLARTYGAHGLTAVLVRVDGVVIQVHRDLSPRMRLEADLSQLPRTGSLR